MCAEKKNRQQQQNTLLPISCSCYPGNSYSVNKFTLQVPVPHRNPAHIWTV